MKRVLHIVGNMDMGGQETFIMNIYRKIDRSKLQFDFVVHSESRGYYDDEIELLGGKIYRITPMSKSLVKHVKDLYKILKENNYDVVHRHTCSSIIAIDLLVAKLSKVKKILVHSHATQVSSHAKLNIIFKPFMNRLADIRLSCSKMAGEFLYGEKVEFQVINNAIEVEKYQFDIKIRENIRNQTNAKDKLIIGHVGRFDEPKNHKFLIEIFKEIVKKNSKAELWLIGDGELKNEIKEKVKGYKLEEKVRFMGIKDNVNEFMMGMDIFLFPSIYEGLGIALIEAQCTGLKCVVSDRISPEAIITPNVELLKLESKIEVWVESVLQKDNTTRQVDFESEEIKKYNIQNLVQEMYKIYDVN